MLELYEYDDRKREEFLTYNEQNKNNYQSPIENALYFPGNLIIFPYSHKGPVKGATGILDVNPFVLGVAWLASIIGLAAPLSTLLEGKHQMGVPNGKIRTVCNYIL